MSTSEARLLSKIVGVRLAPEDLAALTAEATRRQISVPQLLRDITLSTLRTAS